MALGPPQTNDKTSIDMLAQVAVPENADSQ